MAVASGRNPHFAGRPMNGPCVARQRPSTSSHCEMCGFRHALPLPDPREHWNANIAKTITPRKNPLFWRMPAKTSHGRNWRRPTGWRSSRRIVGRPIAGACSTSARGPGFFLKTAKARGWRVMGIEPSRQAAAHARGWRIEVTEGFFGVETASSLGHVRRDQSEQRAGTCARSDHDPSAGARDSGTGRRYLRQCSQRFLAPADCRRSNGWHRRMVDRAAASSELFRLRIARQSPAAAEIRRLRKDDELSDGSVPLDGRQLHRSIRFWAAPATTSARSSIWPSKQPG